MKRNIYIKIDEQPQTNGEFFITITKKLQENKSMDFTTMRMTCGEFKELIEQFEGRGLNE